MKRENVQICQAGSWIGVWKLKEALERNNDIVSTQEILKEVGVHVQLE